MVKAVISPKTAVKATITRPEIKIQLKRVDVGAAGIPGPAGKSAYELAVDNGFVGTMQEWLASISSTGTVSGIGEGDHISVDHSNPAIPVISVVGLESDKTYTQSFTNLAFVTVNHNLNKRPAVTVTDSAGTIIEGGDTTYVNANTLTIQFSSSFTGTITCN